MQIISRVFSFIFKAILIKTHLSYENVYLYHLLRNGCIGIRLHINDSNIYSKYIFIPIYIYYIVSRLKIFPWMHKICIIQIG